jgi:hypothetical protein
VHSLEQSVWCQFCWPSRWAGFKFVGGSMRQAHTLGCHCKVVRPVLKKVWWICNPSAEANTSGQQNVVAATCIW